MSATRLREAGKGMGEAEVVRGAEPAPEKESGPAKRDDGDCLRTFRPRPKARAEKDEFRRQALLLR